MIFLVGARRSGTNWLQRVVGAHPAVAVVPSETYLFSRGLQPLRERFHQGVRNSPGTGSIYMDERDLLDAMRDFCDKVFLPFLVASPGASRLAERTPEHATCLDLIGSVYPDAHVVQIIRDGRDVARSLLNQRWPSAPKSMEDAAEEWRFSIETAETGSRALEHYHTVRYEEMLADPLRHVKALYEQLGLPADAALVEAALIEAEVSYNADPRVPLIGTGKWQKTFSPADYETFMRVAGQSLARLGYDTAVPPALGAPRDVSVKDRDPGGKAPRRSKVLGRKAEKDLEASQRAFSREVNARAGTIQQMLDRIVAAVNGRRMHELEDMILPSVLVRVVEPDADWSGRGQEAWSKLSETIQQDRALDGRQIKGDMSVSVPTATALMTYETEPKCLELRIVAASFKRERIAGFTYYAWSIDSGRGTPA
jgi:hypothetical protein